MSRRNRAPCSAVTPRLVMSRPVMGSPRARMLVLAMIPRRSNMRTLPLLLATVCSRLRWWRLAGVLLVESALSSLLTEFPSRVCSSRLLIHSQPSPPTNSIVIERPFKLTPLISTPTTDILLQNTTLNTYSYAIDASHIPHSNASITCRHSPTPSLTKALLPPHKSFLRRLSTHFSSSRCHTPPHACILRNTRRFNPLAIGHGRSFVDFSQVSGHLYGAYPETEPLPILFTHQP